MVFDLLLKLVGCFYLSIFTVTHFYNFYVCIQIHDVSINVTRTNGFRFESGLSPNQTLTSSGCDAACTERPVLFCARYIYIRPRLTQRPSIEKSTETVNSHFVINLRVGRRWEEIFWFVADKWWWLISRAINRTDVLRRCRVAFVSPRIAFCVRNFLIFAWTFGVIGSVSSQVRRDGRLEEIYYWNWLTWFARLWNLL